MEWCKALPASAALFLGASIACAANPDPKPSTAPALATGAIVHDAPKSEFNEQAITEQIKHGDAATQSAVIAQIGKLLDTVPQKAAGPLNSNWIKAIIEVQRFQEAADLCQRGILVSASDASRIESLLSLRVQCLLNLGRNQDALGVAKQLFGASTMKGTGDAILLVCQCLNAVHPEDRNILKKYRREQEEGMRTSSTTAPVSPKGQLAEVKVDAAPYEKAARAITGEDFKSLLSRGNLLLLADRPDEAWDVFERAYSISSDKDLAAASENLGRCMKAKDGTIGRANAWIMSIRPKPQGAVITVSPDEPTGSQTAKTATGK